MSADESQLPHNILHVAHGVFLKKRQSQEKSPLNPAVYLSVEDWWHKKKPVINFIFPHNEKILLN